MPNHTQSAFLVNDQQDPVLLRIIGKASYLNSAPVSDFFDDLMAKGRSGFVIDFLQCTGMDSTFLGILAATSMDLRRMDPPGSLVLCRLNERNQELVRNVGLHRILTVSTQEEDDLLKDRGLFLTHDRQSAEQVAANAKLVLKAHEALMEVDESNVQKFQDVVSFLRKQVDEEG
jgi:anti-sigma B factor antagonist